MTTVHKAGNNLVTNVLTDEQRSCDSAEFNRRAFTDGGGGGTLEHAAKGQKKKSRERRLIKEMWEMSERSISTFLHLHPDSSFSSTPAHLYIPLTTRRQHALTALFFTPSVSHLPLPPPPPTHPHPPPPPPPFCCSYQHKGHLRLYEDDIPVSRWCGVMWNVQHLLFAAAMPFHLSHYWIPCPPPPPLSSFLLVPFRCTIASVHRLQKFQHSDSVPQQRCNKSYNIQHN